MHSSTSSLLCLQDNLTLQQGQGLWSPGSCGHLYKTSTTTSKQCLKQSITYLEQAYVRTDADTSRSMHATGKARGMFKAMRSLLISICSESATLDFGFPCLKELARGRVNCYSSAVLDSS